MRMEWVKQTHYHHYPHSQAEPFLRLFTFAVKDDFINERTKIPSRLFTAQHQIDVVPKGFWEATSQISSLNG